MSWRWNEVHAVAGAMLVAALLAGIGLTNEKFWDDEANTAIYARNLLQQHKLTAWDGTNLMAYSQGGSLGEDLGQELRVPPLPAYVAAVGMLLFGETTLGGRFMFVVAGVAAVGLLALWMRRFFGRRFPVYLPAIILALSPAYLLYIRNCRYYALGAMLTLVVWSLWTPSSSSPARSVAGRRFDRGLLWRCVGAAVATVLLIQSHYLNAASMLVTLPLFLIEPRFRQRKQYILLGVIYAAAVVCGVWILATVNPLAADYGPGAEAVGGEMTFWRHFGMNLWWLLRDLGTHEFFPWLLAPVLALAWIPARMRPLALRGTILMAIVLGYVVLAALLTPADMGKGPTAEMRYVVPLILVGCTVGGLALVILARLVGPLGSVASALLVGPVFFLLVGTNFLHLGFLAERFDDTKPWWPPTWCRYVAEILVDFQTGNEAVIDLMCQLPPGTTVRISPPYMVYPPMFYAPKLHYCDQLSETKRVRADLLPLPDYVYVGRVEPEVILAPAHLAGEMRAGLDLRYGAGSYRLTKVLPPYWSYTSKPEIPGHFFLPPPTDWGRFSGMAVLVRQQSPVAADPALATDPTDPDALCRLGIAQKYSGDPDQAQHNFEAALRLDADNALAHFQLGTVLIARGHFAAAVAQYEAVIRLLPDDLPARINLGTAYLAQGRMEDARRQYVAALRIQPDSATAHYNLGNIALRRRRFDEAIYHYQAALKSRYEYAKAHVNLGVALLEVDRPEEAVSHFREALRIEPSLIEAHVGLGRGLRNCGNEHGAAEELKIALGLAAPGSLQADEINRLLETKGEESHPDE